MALLVALVVEQHLSTEAQQVVQVTRQTNLPMEVMEHQQFHIKEMLVDQLELMTHRIAAVGVVVLVPQEQPVAIKPVLGALGKPQLSLAHP